MSSTTTAICTTTATPAGPFTTILTRTDAGPVVLASGWTDDIDTLTPQIHPTLRPTRITAHQQVPGISDVVTAFHDGELAAIDDVAVQQFSAEFRSHAWDVLRTVPAGTVLTYTEYAALAGRPTAVRAAAGACAYNAAALFVPCHRVVRTDGTLGGFRWGMPVKQWLLEHEGSGSADQPALPL